MESTLKVDYFNLLDEKCLNSNLNLTYLNLSCILLYKNNATPADNRLKNDSKSFFGRDFLFSKIFTSPEIVYKNNATSPLTKELKMTRKSFFGRDFLFLKIFTSAKRFESDF